MELAYDEEYIEACFFAWYRAGSPGMTRGDGKPTISGRRLLKFIPPTKDGRKPSASNLEYWSRNYGWIERAEALNAQVSARLENEVIEERVITLRELAEQGKKLAKAGLDFILNSDDPFKDNPSAAVRAIVSGSEMRFKYAGQADMLAAISQMNDKQIEREILMLLGKESGDENTIEVSAEDVNGDDTEQDDNS